MIPEFPKYKSTHKMSFDELCDKYSDYANQIIDSDNWYQYEKKCSFSDIDPLLKRWIPKSVLDEKEDERIDTVWL